jgi:hypothetical protein
MQFQDLVDVVEFAAAHPEGGEISAAVESVQDYLNWVKTIAKNLKRTLLIKVKNDPELEAPWQVVKITSDLEYVGMAKSILEAEGFVIDVKHTNNSILFAFNIRARSSEWWQAQIDANTTSAQPE